MSIHEGDCNKILLENVLPKARFEKYRRALCILDPYGLDLDWTVTETIGKMKSVEIFLNFPVLDMNRNVLWQNPENVPQAQIDRMNKFWGDETWREVVYNSEPGLFGDIMVKLPIEQIAEAFQKRLREVAGFEHVPAPIAMRNKKNAIVYYLFFASHKPVAKGIVSSIFQKYSTGR